MLICLWVECPSRTLSLRPMASQSLYTATIKRCTLTRSLRLTAETWIACRSSLPKTPSLSLTWNWPEGLTTVQQAVLEALPYWLWVLYQAIVLLFNCLVELADFTKIRGACYGVSSVKQSIRGKLLNSARLSMQEEPQIKTLGRLLVKEGLATGSSNNTNRIDVF